jgi:aryl-alcohol dehydrogenase-like predicted oxidoreductase
LFRIAKEKNVGIIARVPYAEGFLTGKFSKETNFSKDDWRSERLQKHVPILIEQVEKIRKIVGDIPLYDVALKFCLSSPEVSVVIPGCRNVKQVKMNFGVEESDRNLGKNQLNELRRLWKGKELGGVTFA